MVRSSCPPVGLCLNVLYFAERGILLNFERLGAREGVMAGPTRELAQ